LLAEQVVVVGFRVDRLRLAARLGQMHLQGTQYPVGDLILDQEDVLELPVVGLRPEMASTFRLDQLGGNAHPVARLADAAFEHVGYVEHLSDLADVAILALERKGRRARDHLEVGLLDEFIQDLLGDSLAEVVVVSIPRHVHESQHRDGWLRVVDSGGSAGVSGTLDQSESFDIEVADHGEKHGDDREAQIETGARLGGLVGGDRLRALHPLGRYVEHPGHDHRQRKTESHEGEHQCDGPVRKADPRQHRFGGLEGHPCGAQVHGGGARHLAPTELFDEPAWRGHPVG
jgi:hypothetical protein